MKNPDKLTLLSYLSLFYEYFLDADPASPSCAEEDESMVVEEEGSRSAASTPKDKGKKEDVSEGESKQKKMKKRRSFFRRSSKKKLIGASPSSADRFVTNGKMIQYLVWGERNTFYLHQFPSVGLNLLIPIISVHMLDD